MGETIKGTWEVTKEDGKTATLKITPTEGKDKGDAAEFNITFEEDSTVVVNSTPDGKFKDMPIKLKFKKQ